MHKTEKIQKEVEVIKEVLCDLCGKKTRVLRDESFGIDQFSFGVLTFNGGYGSQHDMTNIRLEICEKCLFEIVNRRISGHYSADGFTIPPGVNADEYIQSQFASFLPDNIENDHEN